MNEAILRPALASAVRRFFWLVALLAALGLALGLATSRYRGKQATATAYIVVEDPKLSSLFGSSSSSSNFAADQVDILRLPRTAANASALAASRLPSGNWDADRFAGSLSVTASSSSNLITISFTDPRPDVAQTGANAVVDSYSASLTTTARRIADEQLRNIDAAVSGLDGQIKSAPSATSLTLQAARTQLLDRRAQIVVDAAAAAAGITASSPAALPARVARLDPRLAGVVGFVIGTIVGVGIAYVLAVRFRRFGNRFEPELILERPLVTEIPIFSAERLSSDLPAVDGQASAAAEAFRFAASTLLVDASGRDAGSAAKSFSVVSALSRAGKTTIVTNLALTSALEGNRVLVIDGDLAGQGLAYRLTGRVDTRTGWEQVAHSAEAGGPVVERVDVAPGAAVDLIRGGGRNAEFNVLSPSRVRAFIASLQAAYDLVLVDTPPVLQVAYTSSIIAATDAVLVVVPHRSPVGRLEEVAERLKLLSSDVAGYLYNRAPLRRELGRQSQLVTESAQPVSTLARPSGAAVEPGTSERTQGRGTTTAGGVPADSSPVDTSTNSDPVSNDLAPLRAEASTRVGSDHRSGRATSPSTSKRPTRR